MLHLEIVSFGESVIADAYGGDGEEMSADSFVAAVEAEAVGEPCDGAFDRPPVTALVFTAVCAASRDPGCDAALAEP